MPGRKQVPGAGNQAKGKSLRRGIGVDVCSVARVEEAVERQPERFISRLLTPEERKQRKVWTPEQLARRWALKEAVAKALGTGIGAEYGFQDIVVSHTARKAPLVAVRGYAGEVLASVSDDGGMAVAVAVAG